MFEIARANGLHADARVRVLAEDASKLSWAILSRYLSATRRIRAITVFEGVALDDVLSFGFNAVEAAVRLYDRDRQSGLTALRDLRLGRQTLAGVRRSLELARAGNADESEVSKSRLLRKRALELKGAETAVHQDNAKLFSVECEITRRPRLSFFKQLGIEARVEGRLVGGANIYAQDAALRSDRFDSDLPAAMLLARFHPRFYLIFSQGTDKNVVDRATSALKAFGSANVGVALQQKATLQLIRKPTMDLVQPDDYEGLRDRLLAEGKTGRVREN